MIGKIKKLFQPTKSHKYGLDYTAEAEEMYRNIASDLGLEIIKKENDPIELSMEFPKQNNLRQAVWVCLQNLDELWFVVDGFTCSMFPFEEVKAEFENRLRSYLRGQYRIRRYCRRSDGKVFKSLLQQEIDGQWITVHRYGSFFGVFPTFIYDIKNEFLTIDQAEKTSGEGRPQ